MRAALAPRELAMPPAREGALGFWVSWWWPRSVRLAKLDSREVARLAVLLTAFAPMAFYFSAIYSESLYLALSVGLFLCARRGRWGTAALLGALASATRSTGVVLILPLLLLYLYGPREDREPERPIDVGARMPWSPVARLPVVHAGCSPGSADALRPRYRLRRDALWLALVPLGLVLYMAHLALAGGDPLAPFHAEAVWKRHFAGPYGGIWDGAKAAFAGLRQLLSFQREHNYYPVAGGSPFIDAGHNVLLFAFLLLAIPMLRRGSCACCRLPMGRMCWRRLHCPCPTPSRRNP